MFCSLEIENVEHLMHLCPKTQIIWAHVMHMIGKNFNFEGGFSSGNWICSSMDGKSLFIQSIIVGTAWYIWKSRCNMVFRNDKLDCWLLPSKSVAYVREYFYTSASQPGRNLILNNFTAHDSPFMIFAAKWNNELTNSGAGFYIFYSNAKILLAGCYSLMQILLLKWRWRL